MIRAIKILEDQQDAPGIHAEKVTMTNPLFQVELADWDSFQDALCGIRHTVFVVEQLVPVEIEMEAIDADPGQVIHVIVRDTHGEPIGTARMLLDVPIPRIGRMAVLRSWRGQGVGRAMLEFLCDIAKKRGYQQARLNSQSHATPFYYKQGFISHGREFFEAGIPHLEMRRDL